MSFPRSWERDRNISKNKQHLCLWSTKIEFHYNEASGYFANAFTLLEIVYFSQCFIKKIFYMRIQKRPDSNFFYQNQFYHKTFLHSGFAKY